MASKRLRAALRKTPPPNPLPCKERGSKPNGISSSPPPRSGEGVGGRGFHRALRVEISLFPKRRPVGSIPPRCKPHQRGRKRSNRKAGSHGTTRQIREVCWGRVGPAADHGIREGARSAPPRRRQGTGVVRAGAPAPGGGAGRPAGAAAAISRRH